MGSLEEDKIFKELRILREIITLLETMQSAKFLADRGILCCVEWHP